MRRLLAPSSALAVAVCALAVAPVSPAAAQKKPPQAEGVSKSTTYKPDTGKGYIDDVFAFDGPGSRLAFIRTDGSEYAEVEVVNVGGSSLARFDASKILTSAESMRFAGDGSQLFVITRSAEDGRATGHLVDLTGKVVRTFGPANDVAFTTLDAGEAVVTYDIRPQKRGMTYEVAIRALDTGKAIGKSRTLAADETGFIKTIDVTMLYWKAGYTQLAGKKKGLYDKFKDQRMNDTEAVYDLVDGSLTKNAPIGDVVEHTRMAELRARHQNQAAFLWVTEDLKGLEWVAADDKRSAVGLPAAFYMYLSDSMQWELGRDGKVIFTLGIDPQNADAVNAKRNDPELIDLYTWDPAAGGKATRVARLPKDGRQYRWTHNAGTWAVLRKHKGFARGGQELELYTLTGK